jgi:hypothetical protein
MWTAHQVPARCLCISLCPQDECDKNQPKPSCLCRLHTLLLILHIRTYTAAGPSQPRRLCCHHLALRRRFAAAFPPLPRRVVTLPRGVDQAFGVVGGLGRRAHRRVQPAGVLADQDAPAPPPHAAHDDGGGRRGGEPPLLEAACVALSDDGPPRAVVCSQSGCSSSRGGWLQRWHSREHGDHGDPTTSRFDSPSPPAAKSGRQTQRPSTTALCALRAMAVPTCPGMTTATWMLGACTWNSLNSASPAALQTGELRYAAGELRPSSVVDAPGTR